MELKRVMSNQKEKDKHQMISLISDMQNIKQGKRQCPMKTNPYIVQSDSTASYCTPSFNP